MTYTFKCNECETEFEISAGFLTIATCEKVCPKCNSKKVSRVYRNAPAVIYKAKDFYSTTKEKR